MRVLAALLPLALAGCLSPASTPDASTAAPTWFHGGLTAAAAQADVAELDRLAKAEGWETVILESFPMQYQARGAGADACERLRAAFQTKPYVSSVGACRKETAVDDPDAPVTSGGLASDDAGGVSTNGSDDSPGAWGFHGGFSAEYEPGDERAVCEAAGKGDSCTMMKSYPPQYAFSYPTRSACEEARERVLAQPHVARVTECRSLEEA